MGRPGPREWRLPLGRNNGSHGSGHTNRWEVRELLSESARAGRLSGPQRGGERRVRAMHRERSPGFASGVAGRGRARRWKRARRHAAASAGARSGDVIIKRHPGRGAEGRRRRSLSTAGRDAQGGEPPSTTGRFKALLRSSRGETSGGQSTATAGLRTHCMIRLHHRLPLTAE